MAATAVLVTWGLCGVFWAGLDGKASSNRFAMAALTALAPVATAADVCCTVGNSAANEGSKDETLDRLDTAVAFVSRVDTRGECDRCFPVDGTDGTGVATARWDMARGAETGEAIDGSTREANMAWL